MPKIQFLASRGPWLGFGDAVIAEGCVRGDATIAEVRRTVLGRGEYVYAGDCEL